MKNNITTKKFNKIFVPAFLVAVICCLICLNIFPNYKEFGLKCVAFCFVFVFFMLPYDSCLGILLFLMSFRGFYHPKWFRLTFYLFWIIFAIKYIVQLVKKEKCLHIVPLIASIVLILSCFYKYDYSGIGRLLDSIGIIATLYLTFVNFNEISKKKIIGYFVAGILSSAVIGVTFSFIPSMHAKVFSSPNRFKALSSHTNTLQMLCATGLACLMTLFFKKEIKSWLYGVLSISLLTVGFATQSKAFLIVSVLLIITFLIAECKKDKRKLLMAMFVLAVMFAVFLEKIQVIINRFSTHSLGNVINSILSGRFEIWKNYLFACVESFNTFCLGYGVCAMPIGGYGAHNSYLEMFFRHGLVGTAVIVILLISYFSKFEKQNKSKWFNFIPLAVVLMLAFEESMLPVLGLMYIMLFVVMFERVKVKKSKEKISLTEKVSIIIPIYKVEEFLDNCVESVINQTYKNLEIILVDDGSPDNCPKICDEWAKKDKRIKVIHKANGGVSSARNMALDIISGDYVCFVDADDALNPQYVEILLKTAKQNNADLAICSWQKTQNTNLVKTHKKFNETDAQTFDKDDVFDLIYSKKVPLIMALWTKIYKKEIFNEIRFPSYIVAEDDGVLHLVLSKCKKVAFVDSKLYYYTHRGNSLTSSTFSKKKLHALEVFKDRIGFVEKNKPQFKDKAIHHYIRILILYYHYAKWANMEAEILQILKQEIDEYCNKGYVSKLTKMFYKIPKTLNLILKIRQKLI